jgi:hypothetical protein
MEVATQEIMTAAPEVSQAEKRRLLKREYMKGYMARYREQNPEKMRAMNCQHVRAFRARRKEAARVAPVVSD